MDNQFETEWDDPFNVTRFYRPAEPSALCFRCGVCCRLWVFLTSEEAGRIAALVNLDRRDFTIEYWDRSVSPEECLVLKQQDGACIFLRDKADDREKACGIYEARPLVCRDFTPSLLNKECRHGLKQYWELTATVAGRVEGTAEKRRRFNGFLNKLISGKD